METRLKLDVSKANKHDIISWFFEQGINKINIGAKSYIINRFLDINTLKLFAEMHSQKELSTDCTYMSLGG